MCWADPAAIDPKETLTSVKWLKLARDPRVSCCNVPVTHVTLGWTGVEAHTSTPQHAAKTPSTRSGSSLSATPQLATTAVWRSDRRGARDPVSAIFRFRARSGGDLPCPTWRYAARHFGAYGHSA